MQKTKSGIRVALVAAIVLAILVLIITINKYKDVELEQSTTLKAKTDEGLTAATLDKEEQLIVSTDFEEQEIVEDESETIYLEGDPIDDWHEMQTALRESNNASDLLIAALFSQSSGAMGRTDLDLTERLLLKAFELEPDNLLVNHQILRFCSNNNRFSICGLPYLNNIERLDPSNGHMLIQLATDYYKNGDLNNALRLMQKAGEATYSSSYYAKYLAVVDQSFLRHSDVAVRGLQQLTFYGGVVASLSLPSYTSYMDMCRERVESLTPSWKSACRNSAKTLADIGLTEIDRALGYRFQYEFSDLSAEEIEKLMDAYATERNKDVQDEQIVLDEEFFAKNPNPEISDTIWKQYLKLFEEEGERQAQSYLARSLTE